MKKLVLILIGLLFSYISFAQNEKSTSTQQVYETKGGRSYTVKEAPMSNYEKYVLAKEKAATQDTIYKTDTVFVGQEKKEWDDLYYTPKTDAKKIKKIKKPYVDPVQAFVDTLKQDNPNIEVNVYDLDPFYYSDRIGRFYYGGFNRWMYSYPWYYNSWMYDDYGWGWNPYYGYNYPYYNDFYFGFGFGFTTFGHYWRPFPDFGGYGWWYSNWSPWRHNEWNRWNNHNYYGNHEGGFGNYNQKNPIHYRSQTSTNINRRNPSPQTRSNYSESKRSYSPSYNNPRLSTRPVYNNSRVSNGELFNRRANVNTQTHSQSNIQRNTSNNQRSTQSRSYSVPSRNYNNSSSRSNFSSGSSGSVSRSSNYSSGSYSSGGGSRSSSSGSSSSGGGRSSGGSSGRR